MDNTTQKNITVIFIIWFMLIVVPMGNRGLWNPDEPRYLQVAWEMSVSNNLIINFPVLMLPWTLLLPVMVSDLKLKISGHRRDAVFYLIWFAVVIVFFSL